MQTASPRSHLTGPELVERFRDDAHCVLWHDNVQLMVCKESPSITVVQRMVHELEALAAHTAGRTGALFVLSAQVKPPSDQARHVIARELARSSMAAAAQVVMGTGFVGSALRSSLTLLHTLSKAAYPMQIFPEVKPAVIWLTSALRSSAKRSPHPAQLALLAERAHEAFAMRGMSPVPSGEASSGVFRRP